MASGQYKVERDDHGFAQAISRDGQWIIHLVPGTEFNEQNADTIVAELNRKVVALTVEDIPVNVQSSLFISKDNFDNAFKTLMQALDKKPDSKNLEELIKYCSWCTSLDDNGNICSIEHCGTSVSEDDLLFKNLSPFIKDGSYIEYTCGRKIRRYDFHDSKYTITEWFSQEFNWEWEDGDLPDSIIKYYKRMEDAVLLGKIERLLNNGGALGLGEYIREARRRGLDFSLITDE
jgi:hypothetical protein